MNPDSRIGKVIEKRGNVLMGFIIVLVVLFMLSGIALAEYHV